MKTLNLLIIFITLAALAACEPDEDNRINPSPDDNQLAADHIFNESEILDILGYSGNAGITSQARIAASTRHVYTLSNEASGNHVIAFRGNPDGTISPAAEYATGGTGTDSGLGNQGALVLSHSGRLLFAVNPGSNEISAFHVAPDGSLELIDTVPSQGELPISITSHHGLVYVLNAGGSGNIAGFAFNRQGELVYLEGSYQPLGSNAAGAAQISFSPNGQALVVTEKATNSITSYAVRRGLAGAPSTIASAGMTPFGFSFGNNSIFYVSEAFGGAAGASTVSAYEVNTAGQLSLIDGPFETNGSAACWVAATNNGRTLFITNTAGNDITSLSVEGRGQLAFSNMGNTTAAVSGPLDAVVDKSSRYLYTLAGGNDAILTYRIGSNGALEQIDTDGGLPDRATGLVVR